MHKKMNLITNPSSSSCASAGPSLEHRRTGDYVQSDCEAQNRAGIKVDKTLYIVRPVERAQPQPRIPRGDSARYIDWLHHHFLMSKMTNENNLLMRAVI